MEQTLILVDEQENVVGYAPRGECHRGRGKRHLAIAVILFDRNGLMLLQKRKSLLWDGFWDIAGATHPLHYPATDGKAAHDESYQEAAARFLQTEWGIATPVEHVLSFTYFAAFGDSCENEVCALLVGQYDGPVSMNPDYAYDLRWVDFHACREDLQRNPALYTPWAHIAIERLAAHPFPRVLKRADA